MSLYVRNEAINPCDPRWGCVGNGTIDDTPGWLAATTALFNAGSGRLFIPPGRSLFLNPGSPTTPARIPPNTNLGKRYVFQMYGGSYVKLSANLPASFQPARTTDQQTWRGIDFIDWAVDNNNVSTSENVIFGPSDANGGIGVLSQRNNYRDIRFIRPRAWNVPAIGVTKPKAIIALWTRHFNTNEGDLNWNPHTLTQNTCTDILVEGMQFDGGDEAVVIAANVQHGETIGLRVKNYTPGSTTVTVLSSTTTQIALTTDEWIHIGTGKFYERRQLTGVVDNGDGTWTLTINQALSFTHPSDDVTGSGKGSPVTVGGNANVWYDRLTIRGGYHFAGSGAYGSNIFLSGHGIGGYDINVENVTLSGSGDNALEVDSTLGLNARGVHVLDAKNVGILSKNFNMPQDQSNNTFLQHQQLHKYTDCTHEVSPALTPGQATPCWGWLPGYNWRAGTPEGFGGASPRFGTVRFTNCRYIDNSALFRARTTLQGVALRSGLDSSITRIEGDITYIKRTAGDSASTTPKIFAFNTNTDVSIDMQLRATLSGTATGGSPTIVDLTPYFPPGSTSTPNMQVNLDVDVRSSLAGVASGGHHIIDLANTTGGSILGDIHGRLGVRLLDNWTSADTNPDCFVWGGNMSVNRIAGKLVIDGCDTSRVPTARLHKMVSSSTQTWMRRVIHTNNNILVCTFSNTTNFTTALTASAGFSEFDLTVTTGAWSYVNETMMGIRLLISGGVGTTIDFSKDSGTTWNTGKILNQASGAIPFISVTLQPGEAIQINNTSIPTVFALPTL